MNAPIRPQTYERVAEMARAYGIEAGVAAIILTHDDFADLDGLIGRLHERGYSLREIGAGAFDAALDDARAQRAAETFCTLGEAAASVVRKLST